MTRINKKRKLIVDLHMKNRTEKNPHNKKVTEQKIAKLKKQVAKLAQLS